MRAHYYVIDRQEMNLKIYLFEWIIICDYWWLFICVDDYLQLFVIIDVFYLLVLFTTTKLSENTLIFV